MILYNLYQTSKLNAYIYCRLLIAYHCFCGEFLYTNYEINYFHVEVNKLK